MTGDMTRQAERTDGIVRARGRCLSRVPEPALRLVCLLFLLAGAVLPGCAGDERPAVVVYTSVDDVFARPIAERFTEETGIEVELVPDTEETKSTGLLNRLITEKSRPVADVFWSGDPMRAAVLARKGVAARYRSPAAAGLPQTFSSPEGYWTGFSCRARVIIYNHGLVPEASAPRSVLDLLDPRFKGKVCIANPLFGTTSMHAAALFAVLGEKKAREFFDGFARNDGVIVSSNGEVRRRVASGEFAAGITDTDDASVALRDGKPVGIVYPDAGGMGTLLISNCAVLIAGAPHEAAGKRFIDFLLRPETERALAESPAAQIPVRPGVPAPPNVVPLDRIVPMKVDIMALSELIEKLSRGYLRTWVETNT